MPMPIINISDLSAIASAKAEARAAAARANGAKSRGPKTPEGKAISARNAVTHGLSRHGQTLQGILLPGENQEAAAALLAEFTAEYKPAGPVEHHFVEMLAVHEWQAVRAESIQQGLVHAAEALAGSTIRSKYREPTSGSESSRQVYRLKSLRRALIRCRP